MGRQSTVKLSVQDDFSGNLNKFSQGVNKAAGEAGKLGSAAGQASGGLGQMGGTLSSLAGGLGLSLGIAGITAGIVALGKESLSLGMKMEQTKVAFTTLTGSADAALEHLDALRAFAAKTPFEFTDLIDASRRLQAFGFEAQAVIPMMTNIGDAVAAMGGGADQINRVTLAIGQMSAKGKVSGQEMLQLTEAGIPAWKYLADAIGVSTAEVMKMSEKGLIPADKAIQAILAGMNKDFGGMMAEQSKTAAGAVSNLTDALVRMGTALGEGATPQIHDFASAMGTAINTRAALMEATARGLITDEEQTAILTKLSYGMTTQADVIDMLTQKTNEAQAEHEALTGTLDRAQDGFRDASTASDSLSGSMDDLAGAALEAKDAEELLKQQTKELQRSQEALVSAGLGGKMSDIYDKYSEAVDKSKSSVAELQAQLDELNSTQGTSIATTAELADLSQRLAEAKQKEADAGFAAWQAQQNLNDNTDPQKQYDLEQAVIHAQLAFQGAGVDLQKLNEAYAESSTAVVDNSDKINDLNEKLTKTKEEATAAAEAMHQQTAELIYQAASIGLTTDAQLELARSMGLIDEQSFNTQMAIQNLRETFDRNRDGMISAAEGSDLYLQSIQQLNGAIANTQIAGADIGTSFQDAAYWISVARDRALELNDVVSQHHGGDRYPSGGATTGGAMRVERDEIVVPGKGGQVLNKQEAAAIAGGKGGGKSVVFNISMNINNDMDAQRLVGSIRQAVNNA